MRRRVALLFAAALGVSCAGVGAAATSCVCDAGAGLFRRARYEAVVARARGFASPDCRVVALRLDDPADPGSLRRVTPGETFATTTGNVWIAASPDAFAVSIETSEPRPIDGRAGFGYRSRGPQCAARFPGCLPFVVRSHLDDAPIDEHWDVIQGNRACTP